MSADDATEPVNEGEPLHSRADRDTDGADMIRVSLRVPRRHVEEIDQLVDEGVLSNRSEGIRAGARRCLQDWGRLP